jgi:hypothetical protein
MNRQMYRSLVATTAIVLALLSGCMMMGMHGSSNAGHGGSNHTDPTGNAVIKEIQTNDARLIITIPRLLENRESALMVRILDVKSGHPRPGSSVIFTINEPPNATLHTSDSRHSPPEYKATELADEGVYRLSYTPRTPGLTEVTAKIWLTQDDTTDPLLFTTAVHVSQSDSKASSLTPMAILGGAGMLVMMALMMAL